MPSPEIRCSDTIALLERFYTPTGIGVDNGGNGMAVVQELLTPDKYRPLALEGRLKGVDFGGMTMLAVRDGREVKKRTKELILPFDDQEIEDQFTTHTYTLSNGNIIYSKGNDHIIDAVRCAVLAREQGRLELSSQETVSLTPVLTDPLFI